jgi:hypothetical protein
MIIPLTQLGGMSKVCAFCGQPIGAKQLVQCKKCVGLLHAYYCSQKCLKADSSRHKDECANARGDNEDEVREFAKKESKVSDTAALYKVGDNPAKQFEVRRELPAVGAPARRRSVLNGLNGSSHKTRGEKRAAAADYYPMSDWKRRFVAGSKVPCKPWACFGSATSLVVTWQAPTSNTRFTKHNYLLQWRDHPDPHNESESEIIGKPGAWQDCAEPHTGDVPSHLVTELKTGTWVQFRVRVKSSSQPADNDFSEPSDPWRVGYADFSPVKAPPGGLPPSSFSSAELEFFMTLNHPMLVQDYIDTIPMNHEVEDETCLSALDTLRQNNGHCIECVMLGAYILSLHGYAPYLMDMRADSEIDDDHIVVPFKINGHWGCLSKSNHASLRYRNPVYKTIRELMMSYFDDYMNGKGVRSLRSYSQPANLAVVFGPDWATRRGDVFTIGEFVDCQKHYPLLEGIDLKDIRPADEMMLATTVSQREWQCPDNFDEEAARRNENK